MNISIIIAMDDVASFGAQFLALITYLLGRTGVSCSNYTLFLQVEMHNAQLVERKTQHVSCVGTPHVHGG